MALGNIVLTASVIVLYCVGCTKSEGWTPTTFREVSNYSRSQDISTPSSSRISGNNNHRDVTSSNFHPTRRDMNSRAMQITVTPAAARVTTDHHLQDATANSFYPSRRDWTKQAAEGDSNSSIPVTTQEYPGHRDYYPSRRERPQQKVETIQEAVKIPGGAAAAAAGLTKPTRYHYYPHNQHIYLLPECAIQQVCNAVYVRLNFTQPLCACPSRYRDPCSASTNTDDLHSTELITDPRGKALTLVKTCEPVADMRECRAPRDWSLLALQNIRTGKSHYLVICRCPPTKILEGPMSHDQPTYASVPGIRVYGMMCVQVNNRRGRHLRFERSSTRSMPPFPWRKVNETAHILHWDD